MRRWPERSRGSRGGPTCNSWSPTGPAHAEVVAAAIDPAAALVVRVVPFIERMDLALADRRPRRLARRARSVAELAACGVPSLLVPYPHATEHHQDANARELAAAGAAVVLADAACTPEALAACILELMDAPDRRERHGRGRPGVGAARRRAPASATW